MMKAIPDGRRSLFNAAILLPLTVSFFLSITALADEPAPPPILVLIIDDLGYELETGQMAVALPGKVNLAILPHTPNSREIALRGLAAGKEILLHAPMSNLNAAPLGAGGLTTAMSEQELRNTLARGINDTPGVRGINNHMGSLLTAQREPMEWVMKELAARGLYFVDSRTTRDSLAAAVAGEYGIPHMSRHVFLDNEQDGTAIHYQFKHALQLAEQQGIAIAIGHPHEVTLRYLRRQLPRLPGQGFRLAFISEILSQSGSQPVIEVRRQALPDTGPE
jgi:polysaccharide deacetylase 2 family uncharacterized protein YibQ